MRQLARQPIGVMHNDRMHQALLHQLPQALELGTIHGRARIVIHKDMCLWHGIGFPVGQGLTCLNLCRERIAFVGLIRGRDTGIDGGNLGGVGLA